MLFWYICCIPHLSKYSGRSRERGNLMTELKIICPECSAVVVTSYPEVLLWEHCPECRHHVWENDDLQMAEVLPARSFSRGKTITAVRLHNN